MRTFIAVARFPHKQKLQVVPIRVQTIRAGPAYPLITPIGRRRATFRASPASWHTCAT